MTLDRLVAYGEPFATATASLRFEEAGVRLDGLNVEKDGGSISGAAFVGWDATYSFNVDGRRIPVESIARLRFPKAPLSGIAEFSANGSATFDAPRNDYRFRVNDLFIGEEGVGQVTATLALRGTELSGEIDAASPRLAVTATGRVAMTRTGRVGVRRPLPRHVARSVRPAVRAAAVAARHGGGQRLDSRIGPPGRCGSPARRRHRRHARHAAVRLRAQERDADSDVARQRAGEDRRAAARRRGYAPPARRARSICATSGSPCRPTATPTSGILQGFFHDVRGSGRADLTAAVDGPLRAACVFGPRDDYQRPRPLLLAAELARLDQRRALVRSARRSARRADRDDGRRRGAVRRPGWVRGLRARRIERHDARRRAAVPASRRACARWSMPT